MPNEPYSHFMLVSRAKVVRKSSHCSLNTRSHFLVACSFSTFAILVTNAATFTCKIRKNLL